MNMDWDAITASMTGRGKGKSEIRGRYYELKKLERAGQREPHIFHHGAHERAKDGKEPSKDVKKTTEDVKKSSKHEKKPSEDTQKSRQDGKADKEKKQEMPGGFPTDNMPTFVLEHTKEKPTVFYTPGEFPGFDEEKVRHLKPMFFRRP